MGHINKSNCITVLITSHSVVIIVETEPRVNIKQAKKLRKKNLLKKLPEISVCFMWLHPHVLNTMKTLDIYARERERKYSLFIASSFGSGKRGSVSQSRV